MIEQIKRLEAAKQSIMNIIGDSNVSTIHVINTLTDLKAFTEEQIKKLRSVPHAD